MYVWSFLLALGLSVALTPLVRALARRFNFVAAPRADRWHRKPTALFGGVGIWLGFIIAYLVFRDRAAQGGGLVVACSSAMFLLGLVDDKVRLKPYAKLIGQIAAATVLTTFGLQLPWTQSPVIDKALTVFWLVGLTNAMNLLDNIDGLSAGIAVIAAAFMTYFFVLNGQLAAAAITAAFAGAVLGFLVYNFNPASIFMGDCGSLFLGFFLGAAALLQTTYRSRSLVAVLAPPLLVMAVPILDTALVTISRKLHGRAVSQGGRDHTSHRLVALGLSERGATLTLYALAILSGFTGVAAVHFPTSITLGVLPLVVMALLFVAIYLGRVKVYKGVSDPASEGAQGRALLPTLADFTYKRRIFEVINDFVFIVVAYYCAFLLRFEGQLVEPHWTKFVLSLPVVIVTQMGVLLAVGVYKGLWQYTGITDLRRIFTSTLLAVVVAVASIWLIFRTLYGFSRAAFILDWLLLFLGVAGSRVSFRLMRNWILARHRVRDGRRVIIYGAGDGGELLLREIQNNEQLGLIPVGFIDDDPNKVGKVIHGVQVLGDSERLRELLPALQVDELVLSCANVDERRLAAVTAVCRERAINCRRARFTLE
ncbi:MAG: hypothetical protein HY906_27080 [Deltaproteobacteria bacterium]|nr:hypothetical protein [Deltaproteobacteria bacterium]